MTPTVFRTALISAAALLVICSLVPLSRHTAWWVRAWDFPKVQMLVAGVAVLVARIVLAGEMRWQEKILFLLLAVCTAHHIWRIFPYTPLAPKRSLVAEVPDSGGDLSLVVANVLMSNRLSDPLIQRVRALEPDLLFAVETDLWWSEQLKPLEDVYPHRVVVPLENTYGLMLFSKLELIDPTVEYLTDPEIPSVHTGIRLRNGSEIYLHLLHPEPPYPEESLETTRRDAEILVIGREIGKRPEVPVIVAGDFNDVAWSRTSRLFQRVGGMLDPRLGRGLFSTFHAKIPLLRWPLDHVFHTGHFRLVEFARLPDMGSDHFPIFAHLRLQPLDVNTQQEPPEPEAGDHEEVKEKINVGEADTPELPSLQD